MKRLIAVVVVLLLAGLLTQDLFAETGRRRSREPVSVGVTRRHRETVTRPYVGVNRRYYNRHNERRYYRRRQPVYVPRVHPHSYYYGYSYPQYVIPHSYDYHRTYPRSYGRSSLYLRWSW